MPVQPTTPAFRERSDNELEAFLLFCCAVAGKSAATTEKAFNKLWPSLFATRYKHFGYVGPTLVEVGGAETPFQMIKVADAWGPGILTQHLRESGFGCYNHRYRTFVAVANAGLNLRTCTVEDLELIPGIGRKTSRFFLLHTRKDFRCAVLDTHILKWFRDIGAANVPGSTPTSRKQYEYWENRFLRACSTLQKTPAELDNEIWLKYSKYKEPHAPTQHGKAN